MQLIKLNYMVFCGLLVLEIMTTVYSKETNSNDMDIMQSDDYYVDTTDDQVASNQARGTPRPIHAKGPPPSFKKTNSTVTGVIGKDLTLECEVQNLHGRVVLWYKNQVVIANGQNVLSPMLSLNLTTNALTIIDVKEDSSGDYFCELEPERLQLHTKVIVVKEPLEVEVPEQPNPSNNALSNLHKIKDNKYLLLIVTAMMLLFLRI